MMKGTHVGLEPDIREHWLEIMRDPESHGYFKARGRLRRKSNMFCALGVLGDIHPDLQWDRHDSEEDETRAWWALVDKAADDGRTEASTTTLPGSFITRLGIDVADTGEVAHTNDRTGGFDAVVDLIVRKRLFE